MSFDTVRWAFRMQLKDAVRALPDPKLSKLDHIKVKFVLVSLCQRAGRQGDDFLAFPSVKSTVESTGLDRKSVILYQQALAGLGLIEDTGERVGQTKQVIVWRLVGVIAHENEPIYPSITVPPAGPPNSPNSGTVPTAEQFRQTPERVPTQGHGTVRGNCQKDIDSASTDFFELTPDTTAAEAVGDPSVLSVPLTNLTPSLPPELQGAWPRGVGHLPGWVPVLAYAQWCQYRAECGKRVHASSVPGQARLIQDHSQRAGLSPSNYIDHVIANQWPAFYEIYTKPNRQDAPHENSSSPSPADQSAAPFGDWSEFYTDEHGIDDFTRRQAGCAAVAGDDDALRGEVV
jgi:hypothetical protein